MHAYNCCMFCENDTLWTVGYRKNWKEEKNNKGPDNNSFHNTVDKAISVLCEKRHNNCKLFEHANAPECVLYCCCFVVFLAMVEINAIEFESRSHTML